jgi:hypothetical protein
MELRALIYLGHALLLAPTILLISFRQQFSQQWLPLWAVFAVPALLALSVVWIATARPLFHDFGKAYYAAGRDLLEDSSELAEHYREADFVNIPIVAAAFMPLALLEKGAAAATFTVVGAVPVVAACYLLVRLTAASGWSVIALATLFAANGPLFYSVLEGNLTHYVLLLLVGGLFLLDRNRGFVAGVLLGVATIIKLPLAVLGPYFLMRKNWRVLGGYGAALGLLGGLSLLFFGSDLHFIWFEQVVLRFAQNPFAAYNAQSLDSFLTRFLVPRGPQDWSPVALPVDFRVALIVARGALLGSIFWLFWIFKADRRQNAQKEFCAVLSLSVVAAPVSWTHYYLFLLIPWAFYVAGKWPVPGPSKLGSSLLAATMILGSLPVGPLPIANRTAYSILTSHYFYAGLCMLALLLFGLRPTAQSLASHRLDHS